MIEATAITPALPNEVAVPGSRWSIRVTWWPSPLSANAQQVPTMPAPTTVTCREDAAATRYSAAMLAPPRRRSASAR